MSPQHITLLIWAALIVLYLAVIAVAVILTVYTDSSL